MGRDKWRVLHGAHGRARYFDAEGIQRVHRRALEQGAKVVKTQLTAECNPQALLPKVPPGLEANVEGAFRKLCEALSIAEGTSEALGGWAHRDPDRLRRRRTSIRRLRKGIKRSVK